MTEWLRHWWRAWRMFWHSKDALVYLMFVLMATVIWFSNAFSTRRSVDISIPVAYTHMPDDYIFTTAPADHVRITLEDEGVDLFANRHRHYMLSFDLSGYVAGEQGSFVIPMDELRQAIAQQLVGDAALTAFTPEVLSGAYTRQHEKRVPVVYIGQVKPAPQHQLCGEVEIEPLTVSVYGTEQALAAVDRIETSLTDFEGIQDTFVTRLPLICPEGLRLQPDSVRLRIIGEQFTEWSMTMRICTPDLSAEHRMLHLFPEQVTVTCRVGAAWFATIDERDIEVWVDLPNTASDRLPVQVHTNNPHITYLRVKPQEVEYLIEAYETPTDGRSAAPVSED